MPELTRTFIGGELKNEVTSVTLVDATAKTIDTTVPSGKRWLLISIKWTNPDDVQRTFTGILYKEAAKTNIVRKLIYLSNQAAANERVVPSVWGTSLGTYDFLGDSLRWLTAGNTITLTWASGGASTGATDADGLVITYIEVDA